MGVHLLTRTPEGSRREQPGGRAPSSSAVAEPSDAELRAPIFSGKHYPLALLRTLSPSFPTLGEIISHASSRSS